jgi:hypothetical protein
MAGQGMGEMGEGYDGRMTSFLGDYDRELDENPDEPLEFEEQFILRVPREVAEGRKGEVGLREMIKGKGLEGLEMKFLGELYILSVRIFSLYGRFEKSSSKDQWADILLKTSRSTVYNRIPKNARLESSIQSCRYISSTSPAPEPTGTSLIYRCWSLTKKSHQKPTSPLAPSIKTTTSGHTV